MELPMVVKVFVSLAFLAVFGFFIRLYNALVKNPKRLRSILSNQGIDGPLPTFLLGNVWEMKAALSGKSKAPTKEVPMCHNCADAILPFLNQWRSQYGPIFMFGLGNSQVVYVTKPDVVKHMTTCTSLDFGKPAYQQRDLRPLLGQGIITLNGAIWAHQKKILAPELYMDKVKGMINLIVESTTMVVNSWKLRVEMEGEIADIEIDEDLRSCSGDVISRACFGSNYSNGKEIFLNIRHLLKALSKKISTMGIPGVRHLPTKSNREIWALEKKVDKLILDVVKERKEAGYNGDDLLQILIDGSKNDDIRGDSLESFIVDNCKNIYLAGYETNAVTTSWCLMLLASHPEWQARVRDEVLQVCNGQNMDANMLPKMKLLTMVIYETLRLYSPVPLISREALSDIKLGDMYIPKGVSVWAFVLVLHTDPEVWGADAYKFNPERFVNGIAGACKFPHLYMPFGIGNRMCLGQNLAMVELKITLALLLSNFSFSLSPKYCHSPTLRLVIEPEHGINLLVKKL